MQLYLIRHAESENNALWKETGSNLGRKTDPALSARGKLQAGYLAEFLATVRVEGGSLRPFSRDTTNVLGFGITHVYCSLMQRSIQTAQIVASKLGLPVAALLDAHECGGMVEIIEEDDTKEYIGVAGPNRAFFEATYPDLMLPEELAAEGWWNKPYESLAQADVRAQRLLQTVFSRHKGTDDHVAVVTHGGFLERLVLAVIQTTNAQDFLFSFSNCCINRIDVDDAFYNICYLNRVDFMPPEMAH